MSLIPAWRAGDSRRPDNAAPSLHPNYKGIIATTDSSAPRPGIGILPHGVCHLSFVISLAIQNEVLTFRTKACIEFMPPIHRLPSGP